MISRWKIYLPLAFALAIICVWNVGGQLREFTTTVPTYFPGKVGIGTNAPPAALTVNGDTWFYDGGTSSNGVKFGDAGVMQNIGSGTSSTFSMGRNVWFDGGSTYRRSIADNEVSMLQFGNDGAIYFYRATDAGNTPGSVITVATTMRLNNNGSSSFNGAILTLNVGQDDIGTSGNRWRDLYLAGDANIAGSVSAGTLNVGILVITNWGTTNIASAAAYTIDHSQPYTHVVVSNAAAHNLTFTLSNYDAVDREGSLTVFGSGGVTNNNVTIALAAAGRLEWSRAGTNTFVQSNAVFYASWRTRRVNALGTNVVIRGGD